MRLMSKCSRTSFYSPPLDMAIIASPTSFRFSSLKSPYSHHHYLTFASSSHLLSCTCRISPIPTKARFKAQAFELNNPVSSSSSEQNPRGICGGNEKSEVGSAPNLGIFVEKGKQRVVFLDGNRLCCKGNSSSLHPFGHWISLYVAQLTLSDHVIGILGTKRENQSLTTDARLKDLSVDLLIHENVDSPSGCIFAFLCTPISWLVSAQAAFAIENVRTNAVYEIGELFELGIQLTYLLLLLLLLGVGSFFVIRQVLVRRELDLSAKELQEQVRSGDASATGLFELGAVMLRRKFYPAAIKYLLQAIEKWDGDDQDLAQVYNALGVSYVLDGKVDKAIVQFENAVRLQPGYVTAWNNLGDAYEKQKEYKLALKAFEEALLFDPNNKVARPRRDALSDKVKLYKGVPIKTKKN